MAYVISTENLKAKIDNNEDSYLVDVLAPESYEARHVPTAVNIPGGPQFIERVEKTLKPNKDSEIIVYCSSDTCMASVRSAEVLEKADYTNVKHFQDGLAGWQNAGFDFET